MSERDIVDLIFLPGFSTAEQVTNVSGRGVGMDVVKTNIERIGGSVDVHAVPGAGTTFRLKIPLTLAIIPALVVACAGRRYAIPQVSVLELVRLEGDEQATQASSTSPARRSTGCATSCCRWSHLRRSPGLEPAEPRPTTVAGSSWSWQPSTGSSDSWSTRSSTPRRSSYKPLSATSRASRRSRARRSSATARSR